MDQTQALLLGARNADEEPPVPKRLALVNGADVGILGDRRAKL